MKEIRVGQVGHQFMGVAHSNAFRNAGIWYDLPCKIVMKAVCAKDSEENLAAFAEKFGWESHEADWRKLVARDDIDLVSCAAPGSLHKDIVLEAAKHGKHILCEKPLANNLDDTEEMFRAVEQAGVRHCCGFSYRSTPAQALASRMVREGRLGRVVHVHARYAQDWPADPTFPMVWRFDKNLAGSGSLGDICAHSIDAARFITSLEFTDVVGQLATMIHERPLKADAPDGPKGNVTVDDVAHFSAASTTGPRAVLKRPVWPREERTIIASRSTARRGLFIGISKSKTTFISTTKRVPPTSKGFARSMQLTTAIPTGVGLGRKDTASVMLILLSLRLRISSGQSQMTRHTTPTLPMALPVSESWTPLSVRPQADSGWRPLAT